MDLETIYEEFPLYRGLNPTTKPKRDFKRTYKTIQQRLIRDGAFPNKQARGLNIAILNEMGEFPYWAHKGQDPVPLGEGIVHKMSGGEPRPFNIRQASNLKADNIRKQRTTWANELMSAAGFETEVQEGSALFSAKNRVGGKAWDHTYELQDFGPRYKAILEDFASESIDKATFKKLVAGEISKNPGDIKRNLKLLDEAENYSKRARVEGEVKEFKKGEAYKVRDAKYTEFQKLDDVTKANKIENAHQLAVAYTKENLKSKAYKVTKVIDKAQPVLKTAGKALPVVGLTIAGGILYSDVTKAAENPSAKNYAKVGLSAFDTVVEGIDTATLGLATPVTMALNLGTELARYQLDHGTASSSERDWDARIASRRSQR